MPTQKQMNVTGLLGYKLKRTQHILRLHMDEALRKLELTTPQYSVLSQLELRPGISNAALARASFITPQTMHSIVSNLEKRKLITRYQDPLHGRILCAQLTDDGSKIVKEAHQLIKNLETEMTATLEDIEVVLLERLLVECFNNLHHRNAPAAGGEL